MLSYKKIDEIRLYIGIIFRFINGICNELRIYERLVYKNERLIYLVEDKKGFCDD